MTLHKCAPHYWNRRAGSANPYVTHVGKSLNELATRADARIANYCYSDGVKYPVRDRRSDMLDMLGDLMHLCDKEGYDFNKILTDAKRHYEEEINGG